MKWYTAIVHVEGHITPVQYFWTRAENHAGVKANALRWFADPPDPKIKPHVALVFEGLIEPIGSD